MTLTLLIMLFLLEMQLEWKSMASLLTLKDVREILDIITQTTKEGNYSATLYVHIPVSTSGQGNHIWVVRFDTDVSTVRQNAAPTGTVGIS